MRCSQRDNLLRSKDKHLSSLTARWSELWADCMSHSCCLADNHLVSTHWRSSACPRPSVLHRVFWFQGSGKVGWGGWWQQEVRTWLPLDFLRSEGGREPRRVLWCKPVSLPCPPWKCVWMDCSWTLGKTLADSCQFLTFSKKINSRYT